MCEKVIYIYIYIYIYIERERERERGGGYEHIDIYLKFSTKIDLIIGRE